MICCSNWIYCIPLTDGSTDDDSCLQNRNSMTCEIPATTRRRDSKHIWMCWIANGSSSLSGDRHFDFSNTLAVLTLYKTCSVATDASQNFIDPSAWLRKGFKKERDMDTCIYFILKSIPLVATSLQCNYKKENGLKITQRVTLPCDHDFRIALRRGSPFTTFHRPILWRKKTVPTFTPKVKCNVDDTEIPRRTNCVLNDCWQQ